MASQSRSSSPPSAHLDLIRGAAEAYAINSKSSLVRLKDVWADIELPQARQVAVLEDVISRAHAVWEDAVAAAEAGRARLRGEVEGALREVAGIREELGDGGCEGEAADDAGKAAPAHKTLAAWRAEVEERREAWRARRLQRIAEFDELQAQLRQARDQIGQPHPAPPERPDISAAALEFLRVELARLGADKERREARVGELVATLRALCAEVGEDAEAALADVHPTLTCAWDAGLREVLRDVYRLAAGGGGAAPPGSGLAVDLCDATLSGLASKAAALETLKAQRGAHAGELMAILHSLWEACEVAPSAPERAALAKLMGGPLRLHARSLERCMGEVRRCEDAKVARMLDIVNAKARELMSLCSEAHIAPPPALGHCIAAFNAPEGRNPGAAADLLSKLVRMLSEVQVLAAKRGALIACIRELEEARVEDAWLSSFEADEERYKGRDANRKLQRALRAQKLRERLPALAAAVRSGLDAWREAEGSTFDYDGSDYAVQLREVESQLEAAATEKACKSQARRQSGVGAGAALPTPPPGAVRTPLPKSLSGRQLDARHSIAVVPAGPTGREQAAAMRSSGHVGLRRAPSRPSHADDGDLAATPGARLPPRTPQANGAARVAAAAAAAMGAPAPAAPTSDRLAHILAGRPATQQGVATLQDSGPSPPPAPAGPDTGSLARARSVQQQDQQTPPACNGSTSSGGGGDDDLAAMFDKLVAQTSGGGGGGAFKASPSVTPPPAKSGGSARGPPRGSATPPSAGRIGASRIPQPQF
ncbi:hypothetical protein Rsub_07137 [Raphidocelis subcapitata]|uniref:Uncharacterized protein n=1 Tax=Raphidocelis subcapitata TaxID=307507 RepID=A0A2V0P8F9_9CHLO|nr:hypothetical protein Rsub_07137 [Raphidocelis subcapitata]|eukprot:GBF94150.1 hypothetical protein Rsub_07137 [Raphidocelis subcapitata]